MAHKNEILDLPLERNWSPKITMCTYTAKQNGKATYTDKQIWGIFPQISDFFGFTYTAKQKGEYTYQGNKFPTGTDPPQGTGGVFDPANPTRNNGIVLPYCAIGFYVLTTKSKAIRHIKKIAVWFSASENSICDISTHVWR